MKRLENINEYMELALRTAPEQSKLDDITNAALGLTGESGEIADLVKKWLFQGHKLSTDHVMRELGDVVWYVMLMCRGAGIDPVDMLEANIAKLRERYPDGFDSDRSQHRAECDV